MPSKRLACIMTKAAQANKSWWTITHRPSCRLDFPTLLPAAAAAAAESASTCLEYPARPRADPSAAAPMLARAGFSWHQSVRHRPGSSEAA